MESEVQGSSRSGVKRKLNESLEQTSEGSLLRNEHHSHLNFACLERMYRDRLLCDVVLVAEGMEVHAHKLILATSSLYFYWKFSEDRKLSLLNRIEIENITHDVLLTVVNYLYSSEILITDGNFRDLLAAAHNLGMFGLQEACRDFLQTNLRPENCIVTRNLAKRFKFAELMPVVDDYMLAHFSEFTRFDGYLELTKDQISDLISREYSSSSEEDVLDCVFRWIRRDPEQRKGHAQSLLEHVQISAISQANILSRIEEEQWLQDDPQILMKVFKLHTLAVPSMPRIERRQTLVVVFTNGESINMEMYDFQNKVWLKSIKLPDFESTYEAKVAIHGTTIYCFDENRMKSLKLLSNDSKVIRSECTRTFKDANNYSIGVVNSTICVVGGFQNDIFFKDAEGYDVLSGRWSSMASMLEERCNVGLGSLNGNLYAVGGEQPGYRNRHDLTSWVECYKSHSWYKMPSGMCRKHPGVCALGDRLFAVGGYDSGGRSKAVDVFDPVKLIWSRFPDLNVSRSAPAAVAVNGHLYVIGGDSDGSVEIYDPKLNTWSMLPAKMSTGYYRSVAAALMDKSILKIWTSTQNANV